MASGRGRIGVIGLMVGLLAMMVWAGLASAAVDFPELVDLDEVTDGGCTACSFTLEDGIYTASVASAADSEDSAYGSSDFGGSGGVSDRLFVRADVGLAEDATPADSIQVMEIRDQSNDKVLEVSIDSDRKVGIYSPAGGLRSTDLGGDTGVVVPNDGVGTVRIEVAVLKNDSVVVRVNGVEKLSIGGLTGATTSNPRYLRAGITGYNGSDPDPLSMQISRVGVSTHGWMYERTTELPSGGTGDRPRANGFSADGAFPGCATCSVEFTERGINASIAGAANTEDSAFGTVDFGGSTGWTSRTFLRTSVGLGDGQTPTDSLVLAEVRDTDDAKMFELYVQLVARAGHLQPARRPPLD